MAGRDHAQRVSVRWTARAGALVWSARLAVAASFTFLISVWAAKPTPGGDTPWLLDGTDFLSGCLSRGTFVKCGFSPKPDDWSLMTLIGPWPPLQYVPDLIATSLGVSMHPDRVRILASLGIASLVLIRDELLGDSASAVVLTSDGTVIQKLSLVLGEDLL